MLLPFITFHNPSYILSNVRMITRQQTGNDVEKSVYGPVRCNCLKGPRKFVGNLIQDGHTQGRDLNPEPPKNGVGVLPRPQRSLGILTFVRSVVTIFIRFRNLPQPPLPIHNRLSHVANSCALNSSGVCEL
jgi:hypothetical protein